MDTNTKENQNPDGLTEAELNEKKRIEFETLLHAQSNYLFILHLTTLRV